MLRIRLLALFIGFVALTYGQSTSNPFDLQYRKPVPTSTPPTSNPVVDTPIKSAPTSIAPTPSATLPGDSSQFDTAITSENPFEKSKSDSVAAISTPDTAKTVNAPPQTLPDRPKSSSVSRGFQIFFLLLSLLFLIFIVNVERNFVRDLWRVIANENYSSLHHRNQRNTMRQILLLMGYAVFIFQAGIFIFNAARTLGYHGPVQLNIWIPMIFVLVVYIIRHSVISYLRWLFNNQKEMTLFGFDISIFNTMVGLVLLPINILILFGPESLAKPLIIIGIIAFVAAYLMRQLRWMFTARQLITNSLFLFFIYLCAVEILPLWAFSKYFW